MRRCLSRLFNRLWDMVSQRDIHTTRHRKTRVAGFVFVVLLFVALVPDIAHAQSELPELVDQLSNVLAMGFMYLAGVILSLLTDLVKALVVLMQYNGFIDSPVVTTGWALVRDTVNMFFVIVLIVIAFGTIFGHQRFQWQQQVPRLLIFAIVINFSKTLAGIMIDFGQVVMLTFVNAISDIAGGNFVQLFGLQEMSAISEDAAQSIEEGDSGFRFFLAALTVLTMSAIALSGVLVLIVVIVMRTVMLWVLVVMAPLAWFAGGASDVVKQLGKAYSTWWENFVCAVSIGPILAFFLWLTLAVIGSGSYVNQDASLGQAIQASGGPASPSDNLAQVMSLDTFIPFVLGIGMILAAVQAFSAVCGGTALGKAEQRTGLLKKAATLPLAATAVTAGVLGRGAVVGGRGVERRLGVKERVAGAGRAVGRLNIPLASDLGGYAADYAERSRAKEVKKTAGNMLESSEQTQQQHLEMAAKRSKLGRAVAGEGLGRRGEYKTVATMTEWMKKPGKFQELDEDDQKNLWKKYGDKVEKRLQGDPESMKALDSFKKSRPDIAFDTDNISQDKLKDEVSDLYGDFDDVRNIDADVLKEKKGPDGKPVHDPVRDAVRERLQNVLTDYTDDDGNAISAYDAILRGRAGKKRKEALLKAEPSADKQIESNYNVETGSFDAPSARSNFARRVKDNPAEIGNISVDVINAQGGNNEVVTALGEAMDKQAVSNLMSQYRSADPDERQNLMAGMENVETALGHYVDQSFEPDKTQKLLDTTRKNRERVVEVIGAPADAQAAGASESEDEFDYDEVARDIEAMRKEKADKLQREKEREDEEIAREIGELRDLPGAAAGEETEEG